MAEEHDDSDDEDLGQVLFTKLGGSITDHFTARAAGKPCTNRSDLSSVVLANMGRLAFRAQMTDWTKGKDNTLKGF